MAGIQISLIRFSLKQLYSKYMYVRIIKSTYNTMCTGGQKCVWTNQIKKVAKFYWNFFFDEELKGLVTKQ